MLCRNFIALMAEISFCFLSLRSFLSDAIYLAASNVPAWSFSVWPPVGWLCEQDNGGDNFCLQNKLPLYFYLLWNVSDWQIFRLIQRLASDKNLKKNLNRTFEQGRGEYVCAYIDEFFCFWTDPFKKHFYPWKFCSLSKILEQNQLH